MVQSEEQLPLVQRVVSSDLDSCDLDSFIMQPFSLMCMQAVDRESAGTFSPRKDNKNSVFERTLSFSDGDGVGGHVTQYIIIS